MEYINIGTDRLLREYMCEVTDGHKFYKPAGGLWCTSVTYTDGFPKCSKWLDYLLCYPKIYRQKMDRSNPFQQKGVLFDVSDDAKIFDLIDPESFEEFKRKYGRNGHISYELLSKKYDGVHIGINKPFGDTYDQTSRFYQIYGIDSLCIFDLDVVTSYRPIHFDVEYFDYESDYLDFWPTYKMEISPEKKSITQVSALYTEVFNKVVAYYRENIKDRENKSNYELASIIGREILELFATELQKLKEQEQLDETKVAYAMATKALKRL